MGMVFPQTRVGFGNPPMPECDSLEFTTVVGQTTVLCGFELTGKMERLIDKFYFDTSRVQVKHLPTRTIGLIFMGHIERLHA